MGLSPPPCVVGDGIAAAGKSPSAAEGLNRAVFFVCCAGSDGSTLVVNKDRLLFECIGAVRSPANPPRTHWCRAPTDPSTFRLLTKAFPCRNCPLQIQQLSKTQSLMAERLAQLEAEKQRGWQC